MLQMFAVYLTLFQPFLKTVPLGVMDWIAILAVCSTMIISVEIYKYAVKKK